MVLVNRVAFGDVEESLGRTTVRIYAACG